MSEQVEAAARVLPPTCSGPQEIFV